MKTILLFSLLALAASSLQADILLDQVMSKEDQQKSGVANLTAKQKIFLEAWINENFELKKKSQPKTEEQLSLSINIENGKKLQLSDNSIWEIAPEDVSIASVWITPFPVKLQDSNDPDYPVLIINANNGVSVKARKSAIDKPS